MGRLDDPLPLSQVKGKVTNRAIPAIVARMGTVNTSTRKTRENNFDCFAAHWPLPNGGGWNF